MRADHDSAANAISIVIADVPHADHGDEVHSEPSSRWLAGEPSSFRSSIRISGSASRRRLNSPRTRSCGTYRCRAVSPRRAGPGYEAEDAAHWGSPA